MPIRFRPLAWPLALAAAALTCSSDELTLPSEGLPAAIGAVSGGGQSATVATPLPDSVSVRIIDSKSRPVEGIKVVFTPILGGGDAIPDTGLTNADGRTGSRWVLGTTAGAQRVQAMVVGPTSNGALTQNFDAMALAAVADTIFAATGDGQSAEVGAPLPDSLVVRVTDQYGNSVSGTVVGWAPTSGGSVSPASSTTGSTGTAATRRTLGTTAGPQGATATAAGVNGSPVVFTMTALPAAPTSLNKVSGDNQTAAANSAVAESLVVRLLDASGNGVPGRNVTFAITPGGGAASPTSATTDLNGRAATRWTLGTVAGGNSLIASSSGFSVTFQATGTAAVPTALLANSPISQTDTAGLPAASPPSVRVTDTFGNPVAGVSIAFAVTGGGGSILPVTPIVTDALGIATLTSWTLGAVAGANTVTATAAGLTGSPLTFSANGVAGAAAQLQIQTQPSPSAQSGVAFAAQPAIRLADLFGNAVTTTGTVITAALATGAGTLGGTLTASTVGGVATFTNLSISGPTGAYTIRFTSGSLTPDTSAVVTIGAGVASRLAMVIQPSASAQNAVAFAQQPRVQVQDAAGNPVAGVRGVTVAINTGGGTLGGTATINSDAAGLATFSGLSITGTTGARTLVFTSAGLTSIVSGTVSITAGAPTQMAVNAGNGQSATAGSAVAVDPSVIVRDVSSNPVSGVAVTFAVASGGGVVVPVTAVTTTATGVAAVTSWTLGLAAGPNTLTADAAPAGIAGDPVTFTATAVAGGAGRLGMVTQPPAAATNGVAFTQAPVVQLQDVNSNPVATAGIAISVVVASGPGGTLGGLTTVATDANGRATFTGLSITGLVGSYTLQFTGSGLTPITSAAVVLSAGAATRLTIITEPPATAQSGIAMAATVVQVQDVSGNLVSAPSVNVTAALASGGGTLTGTLTTASVAGVATFSNLILTGTIGVRTMSFTSAPLTPDVSTPVTLTAGTAASVAFVQEPTSVTAGVAITPAPTVRVLDGAGNLVTTPAQTVALTISTNPGGATLGGTTSVLTVSGLATFTGISLNRSGTGYRLRAAAGALVPDTSTTFNVTAAAAATITANSVTTQADTAGLVVATPPSVLVTDANSNPVAGVAVTFAVTGGGGSILPVTPILTNAAGVATLTSWTLGNVAGANTVTATAAGLAGSPVTFTATGVAGVATQLQIQTQPSGAAQSGVAFAVQPVVRLADVFGNTVPTTGTTITAALASGSGTLGGTLTAATASGLATFTNLSISGPTGAYTVRFTTGALTPDTSTAITIGAGTAARLAIVQQPSPTAQNALAFAQQPTVQLQDAANNPVAQAGVVVAAGISTGGGTLGGTVTATTNAGGLATFTNLAITGTVGVRTLQFTSGVLTPVTSGNVTITAGVATQIAINAGNGQSATVNTAVAIPPSALVRDVSGNVVSGVSVTFAVATGGGSTLPVAPVATNASGLSTLTSWTLGSLAGANSVTATAAGLAGSPLTFTATGTAGAATQLVIQTQPPAAAQSGVAFAVQPGVRLGDAFGNLVATGGTLVTAAIATGTGTLGGTLTASTVGGVATFTNLSISGVSGAYTVRFTSGALTPDTTTAIALGAGAAARLAIVQQPSTTVQNAFVLPVQPTVQLVDGAGNPVALAGTPVTAAILTGGGTLGGTATVSTTAGGLATFAGLSITGTIGGRTLVVTGAGLTPDTSSAVTVTAGAATQIAINAGNGQSATVNTAVTTPPSAIVRDVSGNPVSGVSVTFAVATGGGSVLPIAPITTTVAGLAPLTSWTMGIAAGANSITATSTGLTGSPVTFTATGTAGAATQLQMAAEPSPTAPSGVAFAVQPAVRLADAFGNLVTTSGTLVTAAIFSGTGTLGGTLTATTASGLATFTNLSISGTAGAFTLRFTSGALTAVTSGTITLGAGAASRLVMVVQPSATAQNAIAFAQQPQVQVQDASGNPVAGIASVGVTILTGGGTLGGTTPVSTNGAGLATFAGLSITGTVGARTLQFTSGGLTPVTSSAIALAAGTPTQISINTGNAQSATAGSAVAIAPSVLVRDVSNNPVSGVAVTFAVTAGGGAVLPATPVSTDALGIAAATSWTLGTTAGANSMTATAAPGGIAGNPVTFTATGVAGTAGKLAMLTQPPASAQSGATIAPAPVVQLQDVNGNPLATSGFGITASIASGPGGVLSGGTVALTDVNGRATFSTLIITGPTGSYTLQFSGASVTGVTSSAITLAAGAAARVSVTAQPTTAQSGIAFGTAPTVQVQDATGNPVAGAGRNVIVSLLSGGGALTGTLTQATVASGLATFPGLILTGTIGPRTLLFSSAGLTTDTTAVITLTAGAAAALEYVQQPTTVIAGQVITPAPTVRIRDGAGNTVTTATNPVTLALAANPGPSTLGGTTTVSAVAGVATFSTLTLNRSAAGYTLAASATGLTGTTSAAFTVNPAAPAVLVFQGQPTGVAVGQTLTPPVTVRIQDALGNLTTSAATVGLSFGVNPGSATLGGTTSLAAVAGVATFSTLSVSAAGIGYTLAAASGGLTPGTSTAFTITSATTTTAITSDLPDPSVSGQPVPVNFTVTSAGGTPTGNVTVADGLGTSCVGTVVAGSCALALPTAGARSLTATYAGDLNFLGSVSTGATHGVNPALTTTTLTSHTPDPSPRGAGVSVTWSVAVTAPGSGTPTGNVTVGDGVNSCVAAVAVGGCSVPLSTVGTRPLTAAYAGDANFAGSTSAVVNHTVTQAGTTTAITSDTPDPSVTGQSVPVTYTVTSAGGTPTGNVTVSDGLGSSCVGTVAAGSCALAFPTAGARTLTATYAGDVNFAASASVGAAHGVNAAVTTTTIATHTPNPSPRGAAVSVTWTVPVTAPGAGTPTGNVTVGDGVNSCVAVVAAGGCAITLNTVGTRSLTATYAGDANFAGSSSPAVNHTVTQAATTTAITTDLPDPSVSGQPVTVNFSVTSAGGTPTGNVTVADGLGSSCVGTVAAGSCALALPTAGARSLTATYAGDVNFAASASVGAAHGVNAAATTTTIATHTPDPSPRGAAVSVTWTVSVTGPGAGTPTGNVTVGDGVNSCVAAVAAGGCAITLNTVGTRSLTATYAGDVNFAGSTSAVVNHTVTQAATTTAITSDTPDPSVTGQSVTANFSVTSAGGTPTGNVTVSDGLGSSCVGTVAAASCALAFPTAGARTLTAAYAGDANFATSVSAGAPHLVNPATTTTAVTSDLPDPSVSGQPVTVAYTVTSAGGTPTGNVTVSDGLGTSCVGTVAAASCALALPTAGARSLTATYGGDANFGGSVSAGAAHSVAQATTNTVIGTHTPDPSPRGAAVSVTWTVPVTAPGAGTPTGNVTVGDGVNSCIAAVAAGGCAITLNTVGTRSLTATYAGDANFAGSASAVVNHTVTQATTTTAITSDTPDPSVTGQSVTANYTVTSAGGTPTGNVTVSDGLGSSCVGTVAAGSCALAFPTAGARTLTATYAGDANFGGSASAGAAHAVTQAGTTTVIGTHTPDPSSRGGVVNVTWTVPVTAPGAGTPTGNVTVGDGVNSCVAAVAAGGCPVALNTVGTRPLTAVYAGDGNFLGSTSAVANHTVTQAATTTAITGDAPDPSVVGQSVTAAFTVTSAGGTPTGNVTVADGAGTSCVGTVAAGSCVLIFPSAGARSLTATYGGDVNFAGSASAGATHGVNPAATTTAIATHTPDPSPRGGAVNVTWTVPVTAPGAGTPTGNVTVGDGVNSCVAAVAAGGCAVTLNTVGTRSLTATYAGDANFGGSTSLAVNQTVTQAATITAITSDLPDPSATGQSVTVNYTVTSAGGTPTGNVTVADGLGSSCVGTVAAGSCALALPTAGARTLTATYAGDVNFAGSASAGVAHGVSPAATTTAITADAPEPSVVGQPVAVSYTVTSGGGTPTGNVNVTDGVVSCNATVAAGSCALTFPTAGAKTITATYAGDANFAGSASVGAAHAVNQAATTAAISTHTPAPSVRGSAVNVTWTVPVTAPGAGTPTGNVTVGDGVNNCVAAVAAGGCSITLNTVGTRPLTAVYAGDGNFTGSTSAVVNHTVTQAPTTTAITSDLPDPSVTGQPVTVNYSVTSAGGTPTGNVTVSDGINSCIGTIAAGSCAVTFTTIGAKTITVTYPGDANFGGSASAGAAHTVNQAATTTLLASHTPNPSTLGAPVAITWSVPVTAPGTGAPTGTVSVTDGVNNCSAALPAVGCSITLTTVGARSLTATYSGDANYFGSTSPAVGHTVNLAATTTTISSDLPDPSVTGQAVTVGYSVTSGGGTPTGNVTVSDGAGTTCVGTVAVGNCVLTFTTAGARTITASYATDGNFASSVSAGIGHTVNQAATTTAIASDLPDPSVTGELVSVSFTVTSTGGSPTGNVTVADGLGTSCVGTVAVGSCALAFPTAGARTLTATYAGDPNFAGSASVGAAHAVNQAATTAAISAHTPDPSVRGSAVNVTWTVPVTAPGVGTPTGNVTVGDGVNTCVAAVAAGGCAITLNTVGTRNLTATYAGDANFAGSSSPTVGHTVTQAATTTAITGDAPDPSVAGQSVTASFTVTSAGGTPTGNVTVADGLGTSCIGTVATGSCILAFPSAGPRNLTATYAGDVNFAASASVVAAHGVNPALTTTAISTHTPDPSPRGAAVAVTWTVPVTAPGAGTPTGTVTVGDGVDSCNAAVAAGGCSITLNTVGTRPLTAVYAGDANFSGSTSAVANHTVTQATTTTAITSDLPDPSVTGEAVTVNFTVTSAGGTPTGTVDVTDGVTSCSAAVAVGNCVLAFPTVGGRSITATYLGDVNFAGSASSAAAHGVGQAATITTLTGHTPDPSTTSTVVSFTWSVLATAPGAGTPTGTVTVGDGVDSCAAAVAAGGCSVTLTTTGARSLVASYSGDANFALSSSTPVDHTVN